MAGGVVSILMTDLVGSTAMRTRLGDEAADAVIARHLGAITSEVASHGGRLVKTMGDGVLATFTSPRAALASAIAIQRACAEEAEIAVRVGLTAGEVIERDDDVHGMAVAIAARVVAAAAGGQVLVTDLVCRLAGPNPELLFVDRGAVHLKGVADPVTLAALEWRAPPKPTTPAAPRVPAGAVEPTVVSLGRQSGMWRFADFEADTARRELRHRGTVVHLEPQAFDLLVCLIEEHDRVVSKGELLDRVWGTRFVSEASLTTRVKQIRQAVGDDGRTQHTIKNVHGHGYRFVAEVELVDTAGAERLVAQVRALPSPLEVLVDPATYCGRGHERAQLSELWRRVSAGQLLAAVVAGEAGIGKSRFVAEVAAEVQREGGQVLLGSCFEDAQLPYEPFAQVIRDDAGADDAEVERLVARAPALGFLAPAWTGSRDQAGVGTLDPAMAQAEVFAALYDYVTTAARRAPTLLVVEDIHWATASTRGALRHLVRTGGHVPLLVVNTTRDTRPDLDDDLAVFLADLARYPTVTTIGLSGLDQRDVGAMLGGLGSDADAGAVTAETGGNPLFVREVARGRGRGVGSSLPALLARRFGLLDDADLDVVDLAAVLGREFHTDLVAAASGRQVGEALEALERAEEAGLLAADPVVAGRFTFTHALIRSARYDALKTSRRLELHSLVAQALAPRADDDHVIGELARHACAAAALSGADTALAFAERAAHVAERALAFDEAVTHYRRAIAVAHLLEPPDPRRRLGLNIRLGAALQGAGSGDWLDVLAEAAGVARSLGDAEALAEIVWVMAPVNSPHNAWMARQDAVGVDLGVLMQEALDGLGPDPSVARARTLAARSAEALDRDPAGAAAMAEEALAIARSLDDDVLLGDVLLSYTFGLPDNASARHPTADELVRLGRRTGQLTFTLFGLLHRARWFRQDGEVARSRRVIDEAAALIGGRLVSPVYASWLMLHRSADAFMRGRLDAAEELAGQVLALASPDFRPDELYVPALATIRVTQGRLPELTSAIEAAALIGVGPGYRPGLAVAYAHAGRCEEAREIVDDVTAGDLAGIPPSYVWLGTVAAFTNAVEWVEHTTAAKLIIEQLEPFSGQIADIPNAVFGTVDLALAQASLVVGDAERAEHFAARAAEASRTRGTPIFRARELVRLAAARRLLGASPSGIEPLVTEARSIADQTGAQLIRLEADRYGL